MIDNRLAPYGAFALRVSLGVMFIAHAYLKLAVFTVPGFEGFLGSVGLPTFLAWPIILAELVGGIAILTGFYGRLVSVTLLPVLVGALFVHAPNGWVFNAPNGGWEYPAFLAVAALAHALIGDGAFAVKSIQVPGLAAELGINHSTVFRRLGQIEEALGTTLFERHRTGYALTPAGEEMVSLARRVDSDITAFTRKIAGQVVAPEGELRVTTNDSLLVHLLTPMFASFRDKCPDVRLDVVLANEALNLTKRDADVAIRAMNDPPENLVGRRVATIAWALYGRADEFQNMQEIQPAALAALRWVSLGDNLAGLKAVQFMQRHVAPDRVVYKVNAVL